MPQDPPTFLESFLFMDEKKQHVNNLLDQKDIDLFNELHWNCITIRKGMKSPNIDGWQNSLGCPELQKFDGLLNIGRVVTQGEIVFDLDMHIRNGVTQNGVEYLFTLEKQLGALPETVTVNTASGGRHLYFKTSHQFEKNFRLRDDCEIKVKAQTLLPPSRFAGDEKKGDLPGVYTWEVTPWESGIATLPSAWEAHLIAAQSVQKPDAKPASDFTVSDSELNRLDDMLQMLDPDLSYPEWFKVMGCIKNYYGRTVGLEVFDLWSQGGAKYSQNELGWLEKQWAGCKGHNQNGEEITIRSLMYLANTTQIIKTDVSKYNTQAEIRGPVVKEPVVIDIPCSGLVKRIVDETRTQLAHQPSYGYLASVAILGALAQRRIQCPKTSVMNWFALCTPPDSQKSSLLGVIYDAVAHVDSTLVMSDPASSQALQRIFETNASRFYGSDESISAIASTFDGRAKNVTKIETYQQMLKYFGSQSRVLGQTNAKSTDGSKTSLHPRLTWLAIGTEQQWTMLASNEEFISSGMASRFAPFTGQSNPEDFDQWNMREKNFTSFSESLKSDLKERYGEFFCTPESEPTFQKMKLPIFETSLFKSFFASMKHRQKTDAEHASIWGRMIERCLWYSAVHAYGCERVQIDESDIVFAVRLCLHHVELWDAILSGNQMSDIAECKMALMKTLLTYDNRLNKSALRSRIIPRRFSTSAFSQIYSIALSELLESRAVLSDAGSRTLSVSPTAIRSFQK